MFLELLLIFCINELTNAGEEILGCGGFIKSDVQLDFSRVKIKLYTKKGVLKDTTDCAPNNGYYFVPLYDRGDYLLKVDLPTGWSFDKTEIELNIDGKTDLCSLGKDINFYFKGFGITGKVRSVDSENGPAGVKIMYAENGVLRETFSSEGGDFHFTPVVPGLYTIIAAHPKWKFVNNQITVEVKHENTELLKNSFVVAGYDVIAAILANNEPISDVYFNLFSLNPIPKNYSIKNCLSADTLKNEKLIEEKPICIVQSNNLGEVHISSVPPGNYKLVPFYKTEHSIFVIEPNYIEFAVQHDDFMLDRRFKVTGLTVNGHVHIASNDLTAVVTLTNYHRAPQTIRSDTNGFYVLSNVPFGSYVLTATADNVIYPEINVELTAKQHKLPDLKPLRFESCGRVVSSKSLAVVYSSLTTNQQYKTVSNPDNNGLYCIHVPSGEYHVRVVSREGTTNHDMQFFPLVHKIEVTNEPPAHIVFSQLRATLSGSLECFSMNECEGLDIELQIFDSHSQIQKAVSSNGKYKFVDIPPNHYEVAISSGGLCWENNKFSVTVNSSEVNVPVFKQTGYRIIFGTAHETQINYELLNNENLVVNRGSIVNSPGTNGHCLKKAGRYRFTAVSCHGYEPKFVEWSTSSRTNVASVKFNAISHAHGVNVIVNDRPGKIEIEVLRADDHSSGQAAQVLQPIRTLSIGDSRYLYEFHLQIVEHEKVTLIPKSETMLFEPKIVHLIGHSDCVKTAAEITAVKGRIIIGQVLPPLAGVLITVSHQGRDGREIAKIETKSDGQFVFGPLDNSIRYKISAKKENYFIEGPNEMGNFIAHKMADIIIEAIDREDKTPLANVLVSLSGEGNYRKNLQTSNDGTVQFISLNPGEYFMRPMMKEYKFEPSSKILKVKEGESIRVNVSGIRVAYSAYGTVRSLAGVGEANILVEARSTGVKEGCIDHVEEATTDNTGAFRIRGLLPGCSYLLQLKQSSNEINSVAVYHFENIKNDIFDIKIIFLQQPSYVDVTATVYTDKPEYYRTLRVKVGYGDQLSNPIQSIRLDVQIVSTRKQLIPKPGVLVVFNSLPYDHNQYYMQLESSLSSSSYSYDANPVYFYANTSFKHVYFDFNPTTKVTEYDIAQSSILLLPLFFFIGFLLYNLDQVLHLATSWFNKLHEHIGVNTVNSASVNSRQTNSSEYTQNEYAEIDQIVQNINAVKPSKARKRVMLIS